MSYVSKRTPKDMFQEPPFLGKYFIINLNSHLSGEPYNQAFGDRESRPPLDVKFQEESLRESIPILAIEPSTHRVVGFRVGKIARRQSLGACSIL